MLFALADASGSAAQTPYPSRPMRIICGGLTLCLLFVAAAAAPEHPPLALANQPRKVAPGDRTDRYGDPLPDGAVARLGTERLRPADGYGSFAFSPDGRRLASLG